MEEIKMQDGISFAVSTRTLTARIGCEIDHHTARKMRDKIDERLFAVRPELLVLDFSEVRFMDSSGLGLVLGRCERADSIGARVRLVGLSSALYKLVRLCGVERVKNLTVSAGESAC